MAINSTGKFKLPSCQTFGWLWKAMLSLGLLLLLASAGNYYLIDEFSSASSLVSEHSFSRAYFDRNGQLMRLTLADDDRYRLFTPLAQINPRMIEATIIYEDKHFYAHRGVDFGAVLRATWETYVKRSRRIGASTLTMQVARLHYQINTKTLSGKLLQMLRALQMERQFSKNEIIEAYLNLAPYGGNIEGVGAASWVYFHTSAAELTLPQALLLAVIPQNPTARNPAVNQPNVHRGYAVATEARQRLFNQWLSIHPEDINKAPFMAVPERIYSSASLPFKAPHAITDLDKILSNSGNKINQAIVTTLDLNAQKIIEEKTLDYINRTRIRGINNASALLINYRSMEVIAELGSADFFNTAILGQVNGTRAKRSPGSALKPFIYALALDQGLIHPLTLLKDAPKRFAAYTPENYDKRFMGLVSATDSLIYSRNVPAVELMARLAAPDFYQLLQDAGVVDMKGRDFYGLALALGGNEVTMYELVELYAMLANAGQYKKLQRLLNEYPINSIPTATSPLPNSSQLINSLRDHHKRDHHLLSAEAAYLTLDMLKQNPAVDHQAALPIAPSDNIPWKTGTSFAFRDAWAIGIFDDYVLAVWVGNFSGMGNAAFIGREAAAPLLFEIIRAIENNFLSYQSLALTAKPPSGEQGLNIKRVDICATTGDLPTKLCPKRQEVLFIPGKSPIKTSNIYREIWIDKITGLRICKPDPSKHIKAVFEFWPSDIAILFHQAGIHHNAPPALSAECAIDELSNTGLTPRITSPDPQLTYSLLTSSTQAQEIPLIAIVDSSADNLYWFMDNQYLGVTGSNEAFFWRPRPGQYVIKVVDDYGRSDSLTVKVAFAK